VYAGRAAFFKLLFVSVDKVKNGAAGRYNQRLLFHSIPIEPMKNLFLAILLSVILAGCQPSAPEVTRIQTRVTPPTDVIEPGEHRLGVGGSRLVNGKLSWDGEYLFPLADELGVAIVTLDARHNTWDGIDSPFGPDVLFIDESLQHIFERVAIDPQKVALAGLSDGAAYALAVGRVNGDLFTHLVAVAPGRLNPPAKSPGPSWIARKSWPLVAGS